MIFDDWKQHGNSQFDTSLLWDYDLNNFDWDYMKEVVVQRVIERGWMDDFYFAINKYGGLDKFKEIIKKIKYLDNNDIIFVNTAFNIDKEELWSYKNKQLTEKH
jgi:hypothetical protein